VPSMTNRQNEQLSKYGDTKSARNIMLMELKKLIEANPLFRDKLNFPPFKASRLRTLINQRCSADLTYNDMLSVPCYYFIFSKGCILLEQRFYSIFRANKICCKLGYIAGSSFF
jgi:hypothetical protein